MKHYRRLNDPLFTFFQAKLKEKEPDLNPELLPGILMDQGPDTLYIDIFPGLEANDKSKMAHQFLREFKEFIEDIALFRGQLHKHLNPGCEFNEVLTSELDLLDVISQRLGINSEEEKEKLLTKISNSLQVYWIWGVVAETDNEGGMLIPIRVQIRPRQENEAQILIEPTLGDYPLEKLATLKASIEQTLGHKFSQDQSIVLTLVDLYKDNKRCNLKKSLSLLRQIQGSSLEFPLALVLSIALSGRESPRGLVATGIISGNNIQDVGHFEQKLNVVRSFSDAKTFVFPAGNGNQRDNTLKMYALDSLDTLFQDEIQGLIGHDAFEPVLNSMLKTWPEQVPLKSDLETTKRFYQGFTDGYEALREEFSRWGNSPAEKENPHYWVRTPEEAWNAGQFFARWLAMERSQAKLAKRRQWPQPILLSAFEQGKSLLEILTKTLNKLQTPLPEIALRHALKDKRRLCWIICLAHSDGKSATWDEREQLFEKSPWLREIKELPHPILIFSQQIDQKTLLPDILGEKPDANHRFPK